MIRIPKLFFVSVAVLGAVLADGAGHRADALQCVYNQFGKSGISVEVKWLDANTNKVVKKESISAGQTSCADDFSKTRAVTLRVIASGTADFATKTSIFIGASLVGVALGAVTGGVGAAVVGASEAAIGTAVSVGAGAGELVLGTGAEAGAAIGLQPKDHINFIGLPSHYNYVNVGGSVWDPWAKTGNRIKPFDISAGKPLVPMFAQMPLFRVDTKPIAAYQNVTATTCAFMCASQGVQGCGGFNFQTGVTMRMTKMPNGQTLPIAVAANQCTFFTKAAIAQHKPAFDAKSATVFYKLK